MRQEKVYLSYHKWSDTALANLAGRTASFLDGNANFPTPPIALAAYQATVDDFRTALQRATDNGGKLERTAKDNARKALLEAMKQQAFYVNTVSAGDANKLVSSGFILTEQPQALTRPFSPLLVRLKDGDVSGELLLSFDAVYHAWEYEYAIAHQRDGAGELLWGEVRSTTNSRVTPIVGLEEGTIYYVRVRSRNGKGVSDWSTAVSRRVR